MRELSIDIETFSSVDIKKCGSAKYFESPDFEILLIGYAWDDGPVTVLDLTDPATDTSEIRKALTDQNALKFAYNASFEIGAFRKWLGCELDLSQWTDTMIVAATCGLPRSLKDVGKALGMGEDTQKDAAGEALIRYFSKPCKPTKSNGGRTRNLPCHAPEKWQAYIEYNRQDVVAERAIRRRIQAYTPDALEHSYWMLDQAINQRGIRCDRRLAEQAIRVSEEHTAVLEAEMRQLTGLSNPNSVSQLKGWLGTDDSLDKLTVEELLKTETGDRKRVLELRRELGKSSIAKYEAMQNYMCQDDRCRGLFQFYGASRTGRWAGRGVQLQNLPQNHLPDLDYARELTRAGDRDMLETMFGNVPNTLSELIRTAFIPADGHVFVVADFSAVEARCLAWLANERWRMDLFHRGGDIYCESASKMFGVPVKKNGVNGHLRQRGKVAELACGYGGSVGAMINMGATRYGIPEEDLKGIVDAWREASPHIVRYWWDVGDAVIGAVKDGEETELPHGVKVWTTNKLLHIRLPSGRCIRYYNPKMTKNKFGSESFKYQAYDLGHWSWAESYGPKVVENITQATCRDLLLVTMTRVAKRFPRIVGHVHDEIIVEVPCDQADEALRYMLDCMAEPIPWAKGLELKGAGFIAEYYKKD